jgi:hypothetical protein
MVSLLWRRGVNKLLCSQAKLSPKNSLKWSQLRRFHGFRNTRSIQEIKDAYTQQKQHVSGISPELKLN